MTTNHQNSSDIFTVDLADFEKNVLDASFKKPVLVDLWAEWCSPCIVLAPVLNTVIHEYQGKVLLAKVEVDEGENMKLAGRYTVRGFPTVILFRNAEEVARFSGAKPLSYLRSFIDNNMT